jgi:hypothetical protein
VQVHGTAPILNVSDIGASIAWLERLGWRAGFTWNDGGSMVDGAYANEHGPVNFGSVCCGKAEIFLCCGYQGARGRTPKGPGDEDTGGASRRSGRRSADRAGHAEADVVSPKERIRGDGSARR